MRRPRHLANGIECQHRAMEQNFQACWDGGADIRVMGCLGVISLLWRDRAGRAMCLLLQSQCNCSQSPRVRSNSGGILPFLSRGSDLEVAPAQGSDLRTKTDKTDKQCEGEVTNRVGEDRRHMEGTMIASMESTKETFRPCWVGMQTQRMRLPIRCVRLCVNYERNKRR
jgi:hypothetical protein